jgi:cytochrome c oxidase cbb3-type subunit 3
MRFLYLLAFPLLIGCVISNAQNTVPAVQTPSAPRQTAKATAGAPSAALVEAGTALYQQNCAFCHGRDAGGGETGPDLTRSKLVSDDKNGEKIGPVVLNGRVEQGMPKFSLSPEQIASLTAFLHKQKSQADARPGGRRGVDVADLQTGNAEEGKRYFNGPGGCNSCHSPTGDLAHVALKHRGLKLEQRLLYPREAPAKLTVTLASGETVTGKLQYQDEFVVGLQDDSGRYRSWPVSKVKFSVDDPAHAHADLLAKYTDDDIHNLMAYLQTLR